MAQKIYFDESGFTGSNLLEKNQPFFCYASVSTDDLESKEFVDYIIRKYKIAAAELKGSTLVNSKRFRPAVNEILEHFSGRMRAVINDKKFSLSGKFYEYVFEPVLASKSSLFYDCSFHRFIANYLHFAHIIKSETAEELHVGFENAMRDKQPMSEFLLANKKDTTDEILNDIAEFASINHLVIQDEVSYLRENGRQKWILDLTLTSLYNLLADWNTRIPKIDAYCDTSKPVFENVEQINVMINSGKQVFVNSRGIDIPLTFNLSREVTLSDSKTTHGIQIADIVAAACVYSFSKKNEDGEFYNKWQQQFEEEILYKACCVIPSPENLDPKNKECILNYFILKTLVKKSRAGLDILDNIEAEIKELRILANSI